MLFGDGLQYGVLLVDWCITLGGRATSIISMAPIAAPSDNATDTGTPYYALLGNVYDSLGCVCFVLLGSDFFCRNYCVGIGDPEVSFIQSKIYPIIGFYTGQR
jgi:hypothetical protein